MRSARCILHPRTWSCRASRRQNAWLQAFAWIRQNTPVDGLFALDPHYMTLPGEDYHGFRALAERSVLADYEKDGWHGRPRPPPGSALAQGSECANRLAEFSSPRISSASGKNSA